MKSVKVQRTRLVSVLEDNRRQHREIFLKAMEGYRKLAIAELDSMISDAKAGKEIRQFLSLVQPMDQTKDYDRVIAMLNMSVEDVVELSSTEFAQYVLDDWHWKEQFTTSNMGYLGE